MLVLVDSSGSRGCVGGSSALDAAFEDAFDVPTVRRTLAGDGECALARGIHCDCAVFLGDADQTKHGPIAHLRLRIAGHGTAGDLGDMRAKVARPVGHSLR